MHRRVDRQRRVRVKEQQDLAGRSGRARVELRTASARAGHDPRTRRARALDRAVRAPAIDHEDLVEPGDARERRERRGDPALLVEHRHHDRDRRRAQHPPGRRRGELARREQPAQPVEIGGPVDVEPRVEHDRREAALAQAREGRDERVGLAPRQAREQPLGAVAQREQVEPAIVGRADRGIRGEQRLVRAREPGDRQPRRVRAQRDRSRRRGERAPEHALDPRAEVTVAL